jgi:hypothetical protein
VENSKMKNEKNLNVSKKKGTRNLYGTTGSPATAHGALRFIEPEPTVNQPPVA